MIFWILLAVYVFSALGTGAVNWADYKDHSAYYATKVKEKVVKLYIVPLCPIINTMVLIGTVLSYPG
jgi:hypothetical protein